MKTKAFKENFKGHDILAIWEVDEAGRQVGKYPIISFGVKKAEAIVECMDEIRDFAGVSGDAQLKALMALRVQFAGRPDQLKEIDLHIEKRKSELK